jgi:hypothetical protein
MMSALEMARNPQPYQVPLYMPPFPAVKPRQSFDDNKKVSNLLRNYVGVQKKELARLRGDLTAYRQEAQTAFNQQVAFPRSAVDVGSVDGDSIIDDDSIITPPVPSLSDTESVPSQISFGGVDDLVSNMRKMMDSDSESEGALMERAGAGAGRLTEPELSDFSDLTSGTSVGRSKKVSFGEPMDLTEPESDFAPRASRTQRASRRERRYVDNASNRRLGRVGKSY